MIESNSRTHKRLRGLRETRDGPTPCGVLEQERDMGKNANKLRSLVHGFRAVTDALLVL